MKYVINTENYRDFDTIEINKRAPRAYFIPYSSKDVLSQTDFRRERFRSDLVTVLSGDWDFKYYPTTEQLPGELATQEIDFDVVTVPSTWQRTGYEEPVYINCPYPFDERPPLLPPEMSVGVYRKFFNIKNTDKTYILTFLGAAPCIDLYVNGNFVGYSEGAHNTAEFNITSSVKNGDNELVVVLHKWSTGTFLECQDMFREAGIFRDVLLCEYPETYINDCFLRTEKTAEGYTLAANTKICGIKDGDTAEIKVEIEKDGALIAEKSAPAGEDVLFEGLDVIEWNAEVPTLYTVYVTLVKNGETVMTLRNFTGFKTVKIKKEVFTFNGAKIKFKGVNHHDTHPKTGYVMTVDDLEKDLLLMKELNVNAIRTSHYPPDPHLLMLADYYGFYVVDEADIETHGCGFPPHRNIDLISDDKKWAPRYLDRVQRMYYRDRNHACITMWSLGNEAGGIKCQDICYDWLHEECPAIPVHYEGACRSPRKGYDVVSEMYTHPKNVAQVARRQRGADYKNSPFFLCEYCHAMGVGPGALEEYWELFYSDDILMGGCIWEWADHAVYHDLSLYTGYENEYTYGGDHGEWRHDGNFCVDGLVYPDRTPHTGAWEMRAVYRPIRARYARGSSFTFTNTNRFRSSDYLTIKWTLFKCGEEIRSGSINLNIRPCSERTVKLDLPKINSDFDYHINFTYYDGEHEVAKEQVTLNEVYVKMLRKNSTNINTVEQDDMLRVEFENGAIVFSKLTGDIVSYTANGRELINTSPVSGTAVRPNIFRAPLDNDNLRDKWRKHGFDSYTCELVGFKHSLEFNEVEVETEFKLKKGNRKIFEFEIEYTVKGNGCINVKAELEPSKLLMEDELARFGLMLELPSCFENVEYYGLGELENLPDFKAQSAVGIYKTTVSAMHEPYIKPQDNGNHGQTRWLKITDNDGAGVMLCNSKGNFSFNIHHYTQELLQEAKHREDVYDMDTTVLSIDGFVRGTGTASCGPATLEQYTFTARNGLKFRFTIMPLS